MAYECVLHHKVHTLIILFRDLISELEQLSKSCLAKLLALASTAVFYRGVRILVKFILYCCEVLPDLGYSFYSNWTRSEI